MHLIAIDTAGPACAVAVARRRSGVFEILASLSEQLGRGHADRLIPMIAEALAEADLSYAALDRIAVTTGPGSFTGVRVGVAAARGLALALGKSCVGVGSLAALSLPGLRSGAEGTVVAALDARRGEIYVSAETPATATVLLAAQAMTPRAAAEALVDAPRPMSLFGSGSPLVMDALLDAGAEPDAARLVSAAASPDIADVARLGFAAEASRPPAPLYLRGADAKPQAQQAVARR